MIFNKNLKHRGVSFKNILNMLQILKKLVPEYMFYGWNKLVCCPLSVASTPAKYFHMLFMGLHPKPRLFAL
jgi:hypothetical protein